jgi:hypothetical protein
MIRLSKRLVTFVLAGALLLLAACGGGGDDLESYFEEIEASNGTRQSESLGAIQGEAIPGNIAFFEAMIPVLEAEERRLSEIEPPEAVAALHTDFLASRAEVLRVATTVLGRLNDILQGPIGESQQAFAQLASDPDIGVAGWANYKQAAQGSCEQLSDVAISNDLDELKCDEQGEIADAPLTVVTSASCDNRPTQGASSQFTRTRFLNETSGVLRLFENEEATIFLVELQPGEAESRVSRVGMLFRAEDENGECVGIHKTAFPSQRAQFTGG